MIETLLVVIIVLLVGIYVTLNPQIRPQEFGWAALFCGVIFVLYQLFGAIGGLIVAGVVIWLVFAGANIYDDCRRWRDRKASDQRTGDAIAASDADHSDPQRLKQV